MMEDRSGDHVASLLPEWVNGSLDRARTQLVAEHVAECAVCRAEADEWRRIAAATARGIPAVAATPEGLTRVWAALDRARPDGAARPGLVAVTAPPWWRRPMLQGATAGALALALSAAVVFTPLGSYAQGLITIFQPRQLTAIPVTLDDLAALPDLQNFGTLVAPSHTQPELVTSTAEAAARTGLAVPVIIAPPTGLAPNPAIYVVDGKTGSFTFSASKAATAGQGKTAPPMPARIDGSQIAVTTFPAVLVAYHQTLAQATGTTSDVLRPPNRGPGRTLILARTTVPTVRATGASVDDMEQYLLAQPGVSPQLARAIRSLGDPTSVLPIPVPIDQALSHPVSVQGTSGLALADSSGIGGGIVWQRDGIITGVAGTFSERELLALANSIN